VSADLEGSACGCTRSPSPPARVRQPKKLNAVMRSRAPIPDLIAKQQAKLEKLEARLGRLMTLRVDEEELLADLLDIENGVSPKEPR
jgi:hypothetical protein